MKISASPCVGSRLLRDRLFHVDFPTSCFGKQGDHFLLPGIDNCVSGVYVGDEASEDGEVVEVIGGGLYVGVHEGEQFEV